MADDLLTRFCMNEVDSLKALAHADSALLEAVAEHVTGQISSLSSDVLAEAIAGDAGLDIDVVEPLLEALWPLAMVQRRLESDTDTFLDSVRECLETEEKADWSDEDSRQWNAVKPLIGRTLSEDSSVTTSAKAVELLLEQPLLLCRSRIVTDVRPIFDESANQLKGMLPFHTLILRCHEGGGTSKQVHVALDASDLEILRDQLARAEQKERHIRKSLLAAGISTVDTGLEEEEEADG